MKKLLFVFLSLILGIALFLFVLSKVGWQETWQALTLLAGWQFLLILLIFLIGWLFSIIRWQVILKSQEKKKISFLTTLRAKAVGFSLSYLTPTVYFGGEPLRALILKGESGLDWDKNIFSITVDKMLELTINALVILIGISYLFIYFVLPSWLTSILIGVIVFCLVIGYFFYSRAFFQRKGIFTTLIDFFWLNRIKKIKGMASDIQKIEGYIYDFFSHQPKDLISAFLLALVSRSFSVLAAWLIIVFLGLQVSLLQFFGFIALTAAIYFVPIPGGLGIHEGSQAVIFSLFGLGDYKGTAFSLIIRAVHLVGVLVGLIVLIRFQVRTWFNRWG